MKLKPCLVFAALLAACTAASAQNNNISVVYGISSSNIDLHGAIGDFGYKSATGMNYSLNYTRKVAVFLSLQTGVSFTDDGVRLSTIAPGGERTSAIQRVDLLSAPLMAKFSFLKLLYADAGLSVDKETNYSNISIVNDQSGVGAEAGAGFQYTFSRVRVSAGGYLKRYALVRFSSSQNYALLEGGLKLGIGYDF